jgi:broad specificity phosphatase PhoE
MSLERKLAQHQEQEPTRERGTNTKVRFSFIRHSQKGSGEVFSQDGAGLSASGISEAGIQRAKQFGKETLVGRQINKAYATDVNRTRETLEAAIEDAEIETQILQKSPETMAFFSLPAMSASNKFMKQYNDILTPRREDYVTRHFPGKNFDELNPDQQEEAAEFAEEDALQWYLNFNTEKPDEATPSPWEQAASVAFKINRLINLPDYMSSGKSVDLVSAGHKTSTEAFLKYAIEQEYDGETILGFDDLSEIGGSLKILDSWDLDVKNDEEEDKKCTVTIRREDGSSKSFKLNLDVVRQLATEHITSNEIKAKKIDNI